MSHVVANGIRLEYAAQGFCGNPALVLLRGLGTQMIDWPTAFLDGLEAAGFYVVYFDNRDAGLSQQFAEFGKPDLAKIAAGDDRTLAYGLQDMADDVVGLMDVLQIEKAHVLGISMGGMIAQVLAATNGKRLLSMVSVMSSSGRRGLPGPTAAAQQSLYATPDPAGGIQAAIALTAAGLQICGSPGYPETLETRLAIARRRFERNHNPDGVSRQMAAVVASGERVEMLGRITVPSLVIHGADDPLIPLAAGEDTARCIKGCELQVIAGMGHNIPAGVVPLLVSKIQTFCGSLT